MADKDELSEKQHAALTALLSSPSIDQAAKKSGVSERAIREWLKTDDNFRREYRAARREVVEHAIALLQKAAVGAVGVLVSAMKDADKYLAFRAACAVLDRGVSGLEVLDLVERLEEVEDQLAHRKRRK